MTQGPGAKPGMNDAAREPGSRWWAPVNAPEEVDPSAVLEAMGLQQPGEARRWAEEAVHDTARFLAQVLPQVPHYRRKRRGLAWLVHKLFSPPPLIDQLAWEMVQRTTFNGEAKGAHHLTLSVHMGGMVRAASLCAEVAAVEVEGAQPGRHPSANTPWEPGGGALFAVVPSTQAGRARCRQLLRLSMLMLWGHEVAHVLGGHCRYLIERPKMPEADRKALELDADMVGGSAVCAWLIQRSSLAQELGWSPVAPVAAQSRDMVESCTLASLVYFVLLGGGVQGASPRYLSPAARVTVLMGGFASYIDRSQGLPLPPEMPFDHHALSHPAMGLASRKMLTLMRRTSVAQAMAAMVLGESDMAELGLAVTRRDEIKADLHAHRPFGHSDYLARIGVAPA
jgi:hypothetical protein